MRRQESGSPLALLGGPPVIAEPLRPFQSVGEEEAQAAADVVRGGVLSAYIGAPGEYFMGGPRVRALEEQAARHFGVLSRLDPTQVRGRAQTRRQRRHRQLQPGRGLGSGPRMIVGRNLSARVRRRGFAARAPLCFAPQIDAHPADQCHQPGSRTKNARRAGGHAPRRQHHRRGKGVVRIGAAPAHLPPADRGEILAMLEPRRPESVRSGRGTGVDGGADQAAALGDRRRDDVANRCARRC